MSLKDNVTATLMGIAAILLPALLIEHYTGYAAPSIVFLGILMAAFFGMMFGAWNVQSEIPLDSDGNPMPVCRACEAIYPETHAYDCPEAQE